MVTAKEQKFLLELARGTIISLTKNNPVPDLNSLPRILKERHGVFVSLYINGKLRGCVGSLLPDNAVYESVMENAINAAYHDCRFTPLSKKEFGDLKIEISILTDPVLLDCIDAEHLLNKLNNEEGVIIKKGLRMATFLPQVWEQIKNNEEFLEHLCIKAGLQPDEWKGSYIEVYVYKVEKFMD